MTEVIMDPVNQQRIRAEVSEVLRIFAAAGTSEDLAFAIARSVCQLSNARSVCFAAFINGTQDQSKTTIGTYGYSDFLAKHEPVNSVHESQTVGAFKDFVHRFGSDDSNQGFTFQNSNGSTFYCRKVQDSFGLFTGFLGIESEFDPFHDGSFDAALLVLTIGALRLSQTGGQEYGAQSIVMRRIAHDLNGSLAIIGLQLELMRMTENLDNQFPEAAKRIKSALEKADLTINRFNEFSHLFFAEKMDAEGHYSSSSPAIALRVALESLNISKDQMAMIEVAIGIDDDVRIGVEGVVIYWCYRALVASWSNPHVWGANEKFNFFIDLQLGGAENEFVDLKIRRRFGLEIDQFLDAARNNPYGLIEQTIVLMSPQLLMHNLLPLFNGSSSIETSNGIRTATIRFPRI